MDQSTVLLISDDPEFARTVVSRWQTERSVPAFTVMSTDVWSGANSGPADIAILGLVSTEKLLAIIGGFGESRPAICVCRDAAQAQYVREKHPRIPALQQLDGWVDVLVLLATEVLRRTEAVARVTRAEQAGRANQRFATLGRYMLEMRHGMNNALTSVLGNAELLLLEPGALSAQARDQIDTIHSMALRMHEIMQRFSSLETELQFIEKESHSETGWKSQHVASGS
jgi:signal transduction histidine kinase